jgi:hypothetical protein
MNEDYTTAIFNLISELVYLSTKYDDKEIQEKANELRAIFIYRKYGTHLKGDN